VRRLESTNADFILELAQDGRLLAASATVEELLGWDLARCAADGICAELEDTAQRAAVRQLLAQTLSSGSARTTLQVFGRLGPVWVDVSAKQLLDDDGQPVYVVARDVSDDMAAATQLATSELQWRLAFEHSPIGGALLDADGNFLVVNTALCRMLGTREHELTRLDITSVLDTPGTSAGQAWRDISGAGAQSQTLDRLLRRVDGHQLWVRITAAPVAASAASGRYMVQLEDITGRREAELELANKALYDGLTSAPNRFLTRQWLASVLEDDPDSSVGVLYCDLDRFKVVNDSLGHAAGDALLAQVSERLRSVLRPEDLLGRVGGDEFVVVVERMHSAAELHEIAARLAQALLEPFDLAGHQHVMTLSLGGTLGCSRDSADDVLMRADMALLRAKREGRARYVAFDPAQDRISTREDLQLEDDLRMSLASDELRAFYQPIVSLADSSVVGHEALVRWQHPELGLLPPDRFLDLAESSGIIRPLGWWMLTQACHDAANVSRGLTAGGWVAVNASPSQLARPGVAADVLSALEQSGLPPERLHLEVTETALITASATLAEELGTLSRLGVHIALDDFGTGYSSLSLLRQFPVDVVKIDRSFVEPVLRDRSAYAIVKAVLSMCRDMELPTVAEGIESWAQRDLLLDLGCTHGQGYLFGRPSPLPLRIPVPPMASSSNDVTRLSRSSA
jgi:diguanylate cyclase (GGDEF)-like protein/PAS domain S-box-containing protein